MVTNSSSVKNSTDISQLQQDYNTLTKQVNRLSDGVDGLPNGITEKQYNDVVSMVEQVPSIQAALSNVIAQLDSQSLGDVHEVLNVTNNADIELVELDVKLWKLLNPDN